MKKHDSKALKNDGKRVSNIRSWHKKTQKEFADELGISVRMLAHYEKGENVVPTDIRRLIIKKFKADPTPWNPHIDPRLVYLSLKETSPKTAEVTIKTLAQQAVALRAKSLYVRDVVYSPIRRRLNDIIGFLYIEATAVYLVEHVRRSIAPEGHPPSQHHDILLAGSAVVIFLLIIPTLCSIPWGMKISLPGKTNNL